MPRLLAAPAPDDAITNPLGRGRPRRAAFTTLATVGLRRGCGIVRGVGPRLLCPGSGRRRDAAGGNRLALNVLTVDLLDEHRGGAPRARFGRLRRRRTDGHERGGEEAGDRESLERHGSRLPAPASRRNRPIGLSSGSWGLWHRAVYASLDARRGRSSSTRAGAGLAFPRRQERCSRSSGSAAQGPEASPKTRLARARAAMSRMRAWSSRRARPRLRSRALPSN